MDEITVFDFDKTLTRIDTLYGFFKISSKGMRFKYIYQFIYLMAMILAKIGAISNDQLKSLGIKLFLYGRDKSEVENIGKLYAKSIEYNFLFNEASQLKYNVYIVTASFDVYTKYTLPNAYVLASTLKYENNKVIGLEFNCYGERKVNALFEKGVKSINMFYTDSISDLPLAKISKKIYLVKKDKLILFKSLQDFIEGVNNGRFNI